ADEMADNAYEQEQIEGVIIDEVRNGAPLPGTYPPTEERMAVFRERVGLKTVENNTLSGGSI
ncbi:MAG: hypothetical protein AAF720_15135, partial [Pseudomonadota bacterium]